MKLKVIANELRLEDLEKEFQELTSIRDQMRERIQNKIQKEESANDSQGKWVSKSYLGCKRLTKPLINKASDLVNVWSNI